LQAVAASEKVFYGKSDPVPNLRANGATRVERQFLCVERSDGRFHGQRVELNAFASRELVQWIESRLEANGIRKVIPNQEVLAQAFRKRVNGSFCARRCDVCARRWLSKPKLSLRPRT
jgi:hypothetical protein